MEEKVSSDLNPWYPKEYVQMLELADGSQLKGHASLASTTDDLWIWIDENKSFSEICSIFENQEKTQTIVSYVSSLTVLTFEGYTVLDTVRTDSEGKVRIRMKRA